MSRIAFVLCFTCCLLLCISAIQAQDEKPAKSIDEVIHGVKHGIKFYPVSGPRSASTAQRKLWGLGHYRYQYQTEHAPKWRALFKDKEAGPYPRLFAAYYLLLEDDKAAKHYIKEMLFSERLPFRYNAAFLLRNRVNDEKVGDWATKCLHDALNQKLLDQQKDTKVDRENDPLGDNQDVWHNPHDEVIYALAHRGDIASARAIMAFVNRGDMVFSRAELYLGEFKQAEVIEFLVDRYVNKKGQITHLSIALSKHRPQLVIDEGVKYLKTTAPNLDWRKDALLDHYVEMFAAIGGEKAQAALLDYLDKHHDRLAEDPEKDLQFTIELALTKLDNDEAIPAILEMMTTYEKQDYKYDRLIDVLAKSDDPRVFKKLKSIMMNSGNAYHIRSAIYGLRSQKSQRSLLTLVSMLDYQFPKNILEQMGKGYAYVEADAVLQALKFETKQDFGQDKAKWEAWIKANVPAKDQGE